jgi:hypothetical protein
MNDVEKYKKILTKIEKIMKVTGFYITAHGDQSVGINPITWTIENDFYFDMPEDLEEFRKEIRGLFEFYCGEIVSVDTYEEYQTRLENEKRNYYNEFPVRYLIRDIEMNGNVFKQAKCVASYSDNVGDAIHSKLPTFSELHDEIIDSNDPRFKEILLRETERLENEINNEENFIKTAKRNLRLLQKN